MLQVFREVEDWVTREKFGAMKYPVLATTPAQLMSEEICTAASTLAGQLSAKAILVYTRTGATAGWLSRRRPDCQVIAITGMLPHSLWLYCAEATEVWVGVYLHSVIAKLHGCASLGIGSSGFPT